MIAIATALLVAAIIRSDRVPLPAVMIVGLAFEVAASYGITAEFLDPLRFATTSDFQGRRPLKTVCAPTKSLDCRARRWRDDSIWREPCRGTVLSHDPLKLARIRSVHCASNEPKEGGETVHNTSRTVSIGALVLTLAGAWVLPACGRDVQAMSPERIEQQYGVAGAYNDAVVTPEGSMRGTVVPVTLADGRRAQLVIPTRQSREPHGVYMRDGNGLHPIEVSERANRDEITRSPRVVETRPERPHAQKRSWEKEALIIGGSAGAGTLIGAAAGGRKGAAVGAAAGGVGGLIYDLATRDRNKN